MFDCQKICFSILVQGDSYNNVYEIFLWSDISVPSESTFYRVQKEILDIITDMARESCAKYRSLMTPGSTITMDGSWVHRRNSNQCVIDFIDSTQKKIVDFDFSMMSLHKLKGDYDGSSNSMEIDCLQKMIPRWKEDTRVIALSHDNDGKTRVCMDEMRWSIKEMIDLSHSMKNCGPKISKFNQKMPI